MSKKSKFLLSAGIILLGIAVVVVFELIDFGDSWIAPYVDFLVRPAIIAVGVIVCLIVFLVVAKKKKMSLATASGLRSWTFRHGDDTIMVKNTWYKLTLLVNEQVQDIIKGFHFNTTLHCLRGKLESGETIIALLKPEDFDIAVSVLIGKQLEEIT